MESASWNVPGLELNDIIGVRNAVANHPTAECYAFTLHEIFYPQGEAALEETVVFHQTRSSPNWQGGVVSFATCKQNMRTYRDNWINVWLLMLTPKHCANNAVFCFGRVAKQFPSNYDYGVWCETQTATDGRKLSVAKSAMLDVMGDLYSPKYALKDGDRWDVNHFHPPRPDHTRMEQYDDGTPKWWKDIRFVGVAGRRPPVFILDPCFLFNRPVLYSHWSGRTGRAVNRCTLEQL